MKLVLKQVSSKKLSLFVSKSLAVRHVLAFFIDRIVTREKHLIIMKDIYITCEISMIGHYIHKWYKDVQFTGLNLYPYYENL